MGADCRTVHHDRIDVVGIGYGVHDAVPVTCMELPSCLLLGAFADGSNVQAVISRAYSFHRS